MLPAAVASAEMVDATVARELQPAGRRRARARRAAPDSPYNRDASAPPRPARAAPTRSCCPAAPRRWRRWWAGATSTTCRSCPRGGGTGLTGGAVPTEGGVVCSLERLRGVRELEPALWRMFAEAGVTHAPRAAPGARERAVLRARPGRGRAVADRRQRRDQRGRPARAEVRRDGRVGGGPGGRCSRRASWSQVGGWIRKDVAGYDLKEPADRLGGDARRDHGGAAAAAAGAGGGDRAGRVPAHARGGLRGDRCDVLAAGLRPSVLDFLDGETLAIVGGGYPGGGAARRCRAVGPGFALLVEVDGTRAEARGAARGSCVELLGEAALAIHEPPDAAALWRWRDGINRRRHGACAGRRSARTSCSRSSGCGEGLERFAQIADAPRPALVRVGPRRRGQRARDGARRPGARGGARRGRGGQRGAVRAGRRRSAARSPASTASGWLKRGPAGAAVGRRARSSCTSRSSARSTRRAC